MKTPIKGGMEKHHVTTGIHWRRQWHGETLVTASGEQWWGSRETYLPDERDATQRDEQFRTFLPVLAMLHRRLWPVAALLSSRPHVDDGHQRFVRLGVPTDGRTDRK